MLMVLSHCIGADSAGAELRVKQLSVEVENGNVLRQKVTQEKGQLEIHIASISSELQEANRQ